MNFILISHTACEYLKIVGEMKGIILNLSIILKVTVVLPCYLPKNLNEVLQKNGQFFEAMGVSA